MTRRRLRRALYFAVCGAAAILWIRYGGFEAIEVPYVGF